MSLDHHAERHLIDLHFRGAISPNQERDLRHHLPDCATCRDYYERHLLLESLDPAALGAEERIGMALGIRRRETPALGWVMAAAAMAVVAGGAMLARTVHSPDTEMAARGSSGTTARPELLVYRLHGGQPASLVENAITAGDELAFAYTNPSGLEHLLVFGVDEHKHVYWYYPAWTNGTEDPVGISLASGPEVHELPEAVRQSLDGHSLRIVAVFTRDRVSVKAVERMLGDESIGTTGLAKVIAGSIQSELELRVDEP